eukprot:CAMPEP_0177770838 /NCGR_PEP_ID=MMETSP0491_2-20121128/11185_1 /TAXON_ID=63592 /ORGANISM="Tetraselmis chuii, Strain PLY429" /LENGTH=89 /DNA_ID=CAMNT_0019288173 /DNA_START=129 /DNA_END=398 /DNA_ORIENTATION=-
MVELAIALSPPTSPLPPLKATLLRRASVAPAFIREINANKTAVKSPLSEERMAIVARGVAGVKLRMKRDELMEAEMCKAYRNNVDIRRV